jgi:hypothetical protein
MIEYWKDELELIVCRWCEDKYWSVCDDAGSPLDGCAACFCSQNELDVQLRTL